MVCHPRQASSNFAGIGAGAQNLAQLIQIQAGVCSSFRKPGRTILAAAVDAFHAAGNLRQFLCFFGIGGRGQRQGEAQQLELARHVLRHLQTAEARGLLGQLHGGRDLVFIGLGRKNLGVVSDEGGLHPIGALILDGKLQQFGLRAIEESSGFSQCGRFGVYRPGKSRTQDKELQQGFASGWVWISSER